MLLKSKNRKLLNRIDIVQSTKDVLFIQVTKKSKKIKRSKKKTDNFSSLYITFFLKVSRKSVTPSLRKRPEKSKKNNHNN